MLPRMLDTTFFCPEVLCLVNLDAWWISYTNHQPRSCRLCCYLNDVTYRWVVCGENTWLVCRWISNGSCLIDRRWWCSGLWCLSYAHCTISIFASVKNQSFYDSLICWIGIGMPSILGIQTAFTCFSSNFGSKSRRQCVVANGVIECYHSWPQYSASPFAGDVRRWWKGTWLILREWKCFGEQLIWREETPISGAGLNFPQICRGWLGLWIVHWLNTRSGA